MGEWEFIVSDGDWDAIETRRRVLLNRRSAGLEPGLLKTSVIPVGWTWELWIYRTDA